MAKRKSSELKALNLNFKSIFDAERMQRLTSIAILRRHWDNIVGTMMAQRSEPVAIEPQQDGSLGLIIAVDHSVIAQHIRLLHEDIRKACFKQCRLDGLSKVWTRVQDGAGIREVKHIKKINTVCCTDLRELALRLKNVEDKPLRRQMFQAATAQLMFYHND